MNVYSERLMSNSNSTMQHYLNSSWLANSDYLNDLYEKFLANPQSVSQDWQDYFQKLLMVNDQPIQAISHDLIQQQFKDSAKQGARAKLISSGDAEHERKQAAVCRLIEAYRVYGHLAANINPISAELSKPVQLSLTSYPQLTEEDLKISFETSGLLDTPNATLQQILTTLDHLYCGSIGFEYAYIENQAEKQWLQDRIERQRSTLSSTQKKSILKQLIAADGLEKYLASRYVGQKRFSLEGGDSFIPLIHALNETASQQGVQEILIGMAHRGRLNVLINVYGKPPEELFKEFEGRKDFGNTSGDVKYHAGYSSDIDTHSGILHLALAFNPSHLEIIDAVLMGSVSARQHRRTSDKRFEVMGVAVHGDASVAGQGIVMETLNMSQTNAYGIEGVIHIVINNQVGFTTSKPSDARSSRYCTDIAKMIDAPVFHVNGDDPEAVVFVAELAVAYRNTFKKDVFIDLVCYRRLGHNEADEPAATQPLMYHFIRNHPTPRELYAAKLIAEGICTSEQVDIWIGDYRQALDSGLPVVKTHQNGLARQYAAHWQPYINQTWDNFVSTAVSQETLIKLAKKMEILPEGFEVQRQVSHMLATRAKMTAGEQPLDWGYAETLAYATLLYEGHPIRMSGEDCQRGTFAHRHATLHDQNTGQMYTPLQHVDSKQAAFEIYDSLLSEEGAMGFEYGYASADPNTLVLWEAQYGDFANTAQVVVDQFMSSAWQKWQTLSGLTLLLPHGYEGSGPEHTSARLERYLQLCAEENMQVCMPTTPAQMFHLLRRQVLRPYRTPLIVMTPKSLLRHKLAVSTLEDLSQGQFQAVIGESSALNPAKAERLILCSGKIYYDLLAQRQEKKLDNIAILRLEQLYPFPRLALMKEIALYHHLQEVIWCQEEPKNQGPWLVLREFLEHALGNHQTLRYIGRPASASPAVGYMKQHLQQQSSLVDEALTN